MTNVQIAERKNFYRRVRNLSDNEFSQVIKFVDDLVEHEPNEETIQAMRDVEEGRNLIGPFNNAEELFAALLKDDDDVDDDV